MRLPAPRGPISTSVVEALRRDEPARLADPAQPAAPADPLADDDLQLSLWILYELHYRGFEDVADHWEWQAEAIRLRRTLEEHLLTALRRDVNVPADARAVPERLWTLVDGDDGPPLSRVLQQEADREQFREFVAHRSVYQLKEADPHTWAVPRLTGRAKAALVEIQVGEYGDGVADRIHADLYRGVLHGLGLDEAYGAYVDAVPGITLAVSNVMSLFGLRRDLRGAIAGHLAAYEMTSSVPCRRYAKGLRRLGVDEQACEFFDVHVTADALHEQLAARDLCGSLAEDEPDLAEQILFGATACLHVENRFAAHVLGQWAKGRSSLCTPLEQSDPPKAAVA